jgi:hypothetical protein
MNEPADGIIITISQQMLKEKGYKNWLTNFMLAMSQHEAGWTYWMRLGAKPTRDKDLQFVYLCIGGKIRFRTYYGGAEGPCEKDFGNWAGEGPKKIFARAWVILSGPVERPPVPIAMAGFRGFRYTQKLW